MSNLLSFNFSDKSFVSRANGTKFLFRKAAVEWKLHLCQYYLVAIICPPPVDIGLTDLSKSRDAMVPPPAPTGTTDVRYYLIFLT